MISEELNVSINHAFHVAKKYHHDLLLLEHLLLSLIEKTSVKKLLEDHEINLDDLQDEVNKFLTEKVTKTNLADQVPKKYEDWLAKKTSSKEADDQEAINSSDNNTSEFDEQSEQPKTIELRNEAEEDQTSGFASMNKSELDVFPSVAFQRVIQRAVYHAQNSDQEEVLGIHVLASMYSETDSFAIYFLKKQGLDRLEVISWISHASERPFAEETKTSQATESANQYLENLNEKAVAGKIDPLVGRVTELNRIMQILCRRNKNNPLLVGEPGVGKTALAEGLARKIVHGEVPKKLLNLEIYLLDLGGLIAGTRYRGDFEKRIKNVLNVLKKKQQCVLFIDEIHTIIGTGSAGSSTMDVSNLIKPLLSGGELSFMGATTYDEFRTIFSKDKALMRRFQKIDVPEPSISQTTEILQGLKGSFEKFHNIEYADDVLPVLSQLAHRYILDRHAPDSAIDVLDEVGARSQLNAQSIVSESKDDLQDESESDLETVQETLQETAQEENTASEKSEKSGKVKKIIQVADIEAIVAEIARVPTTSISNNEKKTLVNLKENLAHTIYGQDEAIEQMVSAIKISRSGLTDPERPVANFLFIGPTGVGKTELCRQVAKHLNIELLRFDMSEYMEPHSISRLIGSPPGYVGHDKAGLLTEGITKHPYSLVLLDELEKAHPDVFNLLLQIMDHGLLTDSNGKEANFRNAIIVMTSNAGAREVSRSHMGFVEQNHQLDFAGELKKVFTPEFRNRLDSIIQFNNLDESVILKVVDKTLFALEEKLIKQGISFSLGSDARKWIADNGYDALMGARPIERLIRQKLYQPIANVIIDNEVIEGSEVKVSVKDNALVCQWKYKKQAKEKKLIKS